MGQPASYSRSFLIQPNPKSVYIPLLSPRSSPSVPDPSPPPLSSPRQRPAVPSTYRHVAPVPLASHVAAPTTRSVGHMGGGGDRTPTERASAGGDLPASAGKASRVTTSPGCATDTDAPIWPPLPLSCASISAYTASLSTVRAPSAVSFALGCLCPSSVR